MESDPIGLYGGMNTFGYVEGNPNTKFDIFGQQTGAGLIALCAGPVRGSICVCGGIVAYLFSSSSGSSSSSSPLLSSRGGRVIPITNASSYPKSCATNDCDDNGDNCDDEWEDAYEICRQEIISPNPNRGITGGYTSVYQCAKGLVSQRCGGNRVE